MFRFVICPSLELKKDKIPRNNFQSFLLLGFPVEYGVASILVELGSFVLLQRNQQNLLHFEVLGLVRHVL